MVASRRDGWLRSGLDSSARDRDREAYGVGSGAADGHVISRTSELACGSINYKNGKTSQNGQHVVSALKLQVAKKKLLKQVILSSCIEIEHAAIRSSLLL